MDRQGQAEIRDISRECDQLFTRFVQRNRPGRVAIETSQQRFWAWLHTFNVFSKQNLPLDSQLHGEQRFQTQQLVLLLLGVLKQNLLLALLPIQDTKKMGASDKSATTPCDTSSALDIALFGIDGSLKRLEKMVFMIHTNGVGSLARRVFAYAGEKRDRQFEKHVAHVLQSGFQPVIPSGLGKLLFASLLHRHYRILHERKRDRTNESREKKSLESLVESNTPQEAPALTPGQKQAVCPICEKPCDAEVFRGGKWRSHVDQDLKPYVCISQNCSKNLLFFADSTSWIQHMRQVHTAMWIRHLHNDVEWKCALSHPGNALYSYPTEDGLLEHMKAEHKGLYKNDEELRNLAGSGRVPIPRPLNVCPICGDEHKHTSHQADDSGYGSNFETSTHEKRSILPSGQLERKKLPSESRAGFAVTQETRHHQQVERYIEKHLKALAYYFCHYLIESPDAKDNWNEDLASLPESWDPPTPPPGETPGQYGKDGKWYNRWKDRWGRKRRLWETLDDDNDQLWRGEVTPLISWAHESLREGPYLPGASMRSTADVKETLRRFNGIF
ncbi:hypothetical protein NCS55_01217300 [Fusarium keratoplasticum]|nr:hypothetical protein NCS55_01217300 [Fusarium keratoplasticum]